MGDIVAWNGSTFNHERVMTVFTKIPIFSMSWNHVGMLAVGGASGTVMLYSSSLNLVGEIAAHTGYGVRGASFAPSDSTLATGGEDNTVCLFDIWNLKTPQLRRFQGHGAEVNDVAWHPNAGIIASCSKDMTARLWDPRSGEAGGGAAAGATRGEATAAAAGCVWTDRSHTQGVNCLAWSSSGRLLATGSEDCSIRLVDIRTMRCVETCRSAAGVRSMAFHPQHEQLLASGHSGGGVHFWHMGGSHAHCTDQGDMMTVGEASVVDKEQLQLLGAAAPPATAAAAAGGGGTGGAKELPAAGAPSLPSGPFGSTVARIGVAPIASVPSAHASHVNSICWHPVGHLLATGSEDQFTRFWGRARAGDTAHQYEFLGPQHLPRAGDQQGGYQPARPREQMGGFA